MTPHVSIIIPTYRRWDFLFEAVKSVFNQTYKDWEIIIINDGGGSPKGEIIDFLSDPKVHYIEHQNNMGIASARNSGISKSSGDFIVYLDDDDIFYPNHLEVLMNEMAKNNWEYKDINGERYFIRHYNNREQKVLLKTIMKRMDKYTLDKIGFYFGHDFKYGRELVGDS